MYVSEFSGMSMDEIWAIKDTNRFLIAMQHHLVDKSTHNKTDMNMDKLSRSERTFLIAILCQAEIDNGGFIQCFENFAGMFSDELVEAFQEIGAPQIAKICHKALNVFGQELPKDQQKRLEFCDTFFDGSSDDENNEVDCILEECDRAFYQAEEDLNLNTLYYTYILDNKTNFS